MTDVHPAGHTGEFAPLATAPRDGSPVTLRFRDPAVPEHEPADRAARFETGHAKATRWRLADTLDILSDRDTDGWTWAQPDYNTVAYAMARADAMDAAHDTDLAHDTAKARNKLPWQVVLATRGRT